METSSTLGKWIGVRARGLHLAWASMLVSLSALAGQVPLVVPDTSWQLVGGWESGDVDRFEELAADLPHELRHPAGGVLIERVVAPDLPADLGTLHTVAVPQRRGRIITVGLEGLEVALASWAARNDYALADGEALTSSLFRRQLTHALAHAADAEHGWSRTGAWVRISGWGRVVRRGSPAERDTLSFATPHGRSSVREDFATAVELYAIADPLPGDPLYAAPCRMPSKWRFLDAVVGWESPVEAGCATLDEIRLDPERVQSIELLYVHAHATSPASLLGHVLVALVFKPERGQQPRREVFELVAITDGTASASVGYILRGISGGFSSAVLTHSYRSVLLRYAKDDRGIVRLRMNLTDEQKRRVLFRLDELREGWDRPYLFFHRNCTHLPKEVIEAAIGRGAGLPPVFGPDALLGKAERLGLIEVIEEPGFNELPPSGRAEVAARRREDLEAGLLAQYPALGDAFAGAFRDIDARSPTRRQQGYATVAHHATQAIPTDPALAEAFAEYFLWSEHVVEQAERTRPRARINPNSGAAIDGVRAGRAAITDPLAEAGVGWPDAGQPQTAAPGRGAETSHSPLRRLEIAGVVRHSGSGYAPAIAVGSSLYRGRLGESRRFSMANGLDVDVLSFDVMAGSTEQSLVQYRLLGLDFTRLWGQARVGNGGFHFRLLELDGGVDASALPGLTPLEVGPALELVQADAHRFHLLLVGGVGPRFGASPTSGAWRPGLRIPVGVRGRLGSRTQAMTGLDLHLDWVTTWSGSDRWATAGAGLGGQVRLAEVFGADIALTANVGASSRAEGGERWPAPSTQARLGLWIEAW